MLLKINQLYFSHSPEKRLFHNFNLKVEAGKIIALAGESGCGKSTLINLIYGLLDWEKGEIIFDGKPVFGPKKNIVPGENETVSYTHLDVYKRQLFARRFNSANFHSKISKAII